MATIFDCDGTLVDSETLSNAVLAEFVAEHGLHITADQALQLFRGMKMANCIALVEDRLGHRLPDTFVPEFRRRMAAAFRTGLQPIDGAAELLRGIAGPICVASSGPVDKIRLCLDLTGLLHFFHGRIFSSYEIQSWKPDPDLFLHAAWSMRVEPENCCVVEDSILGVRAALAAGMTVFAYQPFGTHPEMPPQVTTVRHLSELQPLLGEANRAIRTGCLTSQ